MNSLLLILHSLGYRVLAMYLHFLRFLRNYSAHMELILASIEFFWNDGYLILNVIDI